MLGRLRVLGWGRGISKMVQAQKQVERERERETWLRIYPVDARSGTRTEQAARTDVIPAAVPSMVFSSKWKEYHTC
jgi:hypothetical protein